VVTFHHGDNAVFVRRRTQLGKMREGSGPILGRATIELRNQILPMTRKNADSRKVRLS
jgi:hypothetical protein